MKRIICLAFLIPSLSFASGFSCTGSGFNINLQSNPASLTISGNGFSGPASNVKYTSTFETVFQGNTSKPVATIKITIKDANFAKPGDQFSSILQISSASGIKDYTPFTCIKGN